MCWVPLAGVVGTLQAVEVVKELAGIGSSLSGTLLLYDAAAAHLERIRIGRRPGCAGCAGHALTEQTLTTKGRSR